MDERFYRVSITRSVVEVMVAVFVIHVGLSRFVHLPRAGNRYEWLLGVAYFVFGLFAAFAIENARSGLSRVNELLKAGDADLISIHELAKVFGPGKINNRCRLWRASVAVGWVASAVLVSIGSSFALSMVFIGTTGYDL